ncbi:NAC domain-containing protein 6 isoform X3 [Ricinus communis]|uniref:NAC domain-containing protein 6 isoform X3 n=1 Tax=Ricinus communis TaxID=3988 RepID=UPI00201ADB05|nr:NAC domain-containing protein 6 isoform X3 [Ricinus communis]
MASPTQLISRNLPVGWRFRPTDEELLCNYLKPKILGDPIGGSDVEEDNLCDYDPWDLFGKFKSKYGDDKERYFLSPCEYYERSGLRKRKAKSGGYWKCTGDPRLITLGDSDEVIGTKRSLVYHNPNATDLIKTEYTYTAKLDRPILGNFVLYKLKRKSKKKQAPSKRAMKAKPHCRKTRPNKKARRDESSNSTASSLAFENKNTKDTIANAANGAEDFDNQNQYQKTDVPVPEEDYCIVMASEVGDTTIQEVQYQYNKTDMPNLEDYSGFLKASDIEETPYEEVQSHYKKANMPNLEDKEGPLIASDIEEAISLAVDPQQLAEMIACLDSVLQQPVHTNESPNRICFGMQDHYEKIDKPILNNGPLTGESMVTEQIDPQQLEEIFAFFELKDIVNSQQQPIHTEECPNASGFDTGMST